MSDAWRRTDTSAEKDTELKRPNKSETITDETSRIQREKNSLLTTKKPVSPLHFSRKRRAIRRPSDEDITVSSVRGKKTGNLDLEPDRFTKLLNIQPEENSLETEKQQAHLKQRQNQASPKNSKQSSSTISKLEQAQEQVVGQIKNRRKIKSSICSGEISTTELSNTVAKHVDTLLKYRDLFFEDADGDTILHLAIVHKNIDLIHATVLAMVKRKDENSKASKGINIANKLRQTALHLAILTSQPDVVQYLVQHGADINAVDRNGQTALHLACKNADVDNIQVLKGRVSTDKSEQSIDVNVKNYEGLAPVHIAALTGSCEVIEELLDMGADIDLKDSKSGRTALHHAVEAHNPIVTRFLLSKDADVNAQTFAGNTPLHTATGCRMDNIAVILLEFGADRRLTNFEGDLPVPETYMPYLVMRNAEQRSKEKKKK